jgi:beta-D-xylosidase 4
LCSGAITDIEESHKYTNTTDATLAVTFTGGTDIGCDGFIPPNLPQALADGAITQAQVDNALTNLFTVRMRLGEFDPFESQPYRQIPASIVCSNASQQLALDAAKQGMTLLKNTAGAGLPLSKTAIKTVAVVGPNAAVTGTMQGNYYGNPCVTIQSPSSALSTYATVNYVEGCTIAGTDASGIPAAVTAAQAADATVIIAGMDASQESVLNDCITMQRCYPCRY